MKLHPIPVKKVMDKPYMVGIRTGFLIGMGTGWVVMSLLYDGNINLVMGLLIFVIGSVEYLLQIRENYVFIKVE